MGFWKNENGEENGKAKLWLILGITAVGILLLLLGGGGLLEQKSEQAQENNQTTDEEELRRYQSYLEEKIKVLCESVSGVSNVTVAVTLSGGFESIYATEINDGDEVYVLLGSGSSQNGLLLSHDAPQIIGIGIVCRGGGSSAVQRELTALLSSAFDLSSNRIYVTEAKN